MVGADPDGEGPGPGPGDLMQADGDDAFDHGGVRGKKSSALDNLEASMQDIGLGSGSNRQGGSRKAGHAKE